MRSTSNKSVLSTSLATKTAHNAKRKARGRDGSTIQPPILHCEVLHLTCVRLAGGGKSVVNIVLTRQRRGKPTGQQHTLPDTP